MADPSNTNTLLLAQTVASFSRSELRWELAIIGAAVAILSIAVAAIALFCFRRGTRDLTLIYFGLLCILYAVRVLASFSSFRSIFNEPQMFLELRQLGHHMHNHSSPRPLPLPTFRRTPQKLLPLASGRTNGLRDFRDSCRRAESQSH